MEDHFEAGLDGLRQKLVRMAGDTQTAVNSAVRAITERDYDLALRVKEADDTIDRHEVEIDELAIQLLTKAPLATDLRLVTVAMKIARELERVGDEATKIAKRARDLSREPSIQLDLDLPRMGRLALDMLQRALDSFVSRDPAAARVLIPRDKEVDVLNKQAHALLAQHMVDNPSTIGRCLQWMVAAKSLERIADHAANIAEDVVYLYEGRDIRHTGFKNQPAAR
jgi:phosphate transport system protein